MELGSFIDQSGFSEAFLGNQLSRLVELIVDQGDVLLKDAGVSFPSRAASTILLIGKQDGLSAADIAIELQQPHQLATQRIDALIKLDLVERKNDPKDARRKTLSLTARGKKEATVLEKTLRKAQSAFQNLYQEIEINLSTVAIQSIAALSKKPLSKRVSEEVLGANDAGRAGQSNLESTDA